MLVTYVKIALLCFHPLKGVSTAISFVRPFRDCTVDAIKLIFLLDPRSIIPEIDRLFSKEWKISQPETIKLTFLDNHTLS